MYYHWNSFALFISLFLGKTYGEYQYAGGTVGRGSVDSCGDAELQICAEKADALLKDPNLIFPDNQEALNAVCSTWTTFTDCIHLYTIKCLSSLQKNSFERSFREPVTSMNVLCQDKEYRKEYLRFAPCIKKVSTDSVNCGNQYKFLIDQVASATSSMKQICCSRAKFKACIVMRTKEVCNDKRTGQQFNLYQSTSNSKENNATAFAVRTLDKSLAFIAQQCSQINIGEEECPGIENLNEFRPNSKGPIHHLEEHHISSEKIQSSSGTSNSKGQSSSLSSGSSSSSSSNTPSSHSPLQPQKVNLLQPSDSIQPQNSNRVNEIQINRINGNSLNGKNSLTRKPTEIYTRRPAANKKEEAENNSNLLHYQSHSTIFPFILIFAIQFLID